MNEYSSARGTWARKRALRHTRTRWQEVDTGCSRLHCETKRHRGRGTERQRVGETDEKRQTDRQTDRQTESERERERERERESVVLWARYAHDTVHPLPCDAALRISGRHWHRETQAETARDRDRQRQRGGG